MKVGNASTTNSSSSSSKQNVGVIIGVVVGSIAALAIFILFMIYFIFYHPTQRDENAPHPTMDELPVPFVPTGGKQNVTTFILSKFYQIIHS